MVLLHTCVPCLPPWAEAEMAGTQDTGGPRRTGPLGEQPCAMSVTVAPSLQSLCKAKQSLDMEVEPTVTFLFTLLNTPEPEV